MKALSCVIIPWYDTPDVVLLSVYFPVQNYNSWQSWNSFVYFHFPLSIKADTLSNEMNPFFCILQMLRFNQHQFKCSYRYIKIWCVWETFLIISSCMIYSESGFFNIYVVSLYTALIANDVYHWLICCIRSDFKINLSGTFVVHISILASQRLSPHADNGFKWLIVRVLK